MRVLSGLLFTTVLLVAPPADAQGHFGRPDPVADFSHNAAEALVLGGKALALGEQFRATLDDARNDYFRKGVGEQRYTDLLFQRDMAVFSSSLVGGTANLNVMAPLLGAGFSTSPLFNDWVNGVRQTLGVTRRDQIINPEPDAVKHSLTNPENINNYNTYKASRDLGEYYDFCKNKAAGMLASLAAGCQDVLKKVEGPAYRTPEQIAQGAARETRLKECGPKALEAGFPLRPGHPGVITPEDKANREGFNEYVRRCSFGMELGPAQVAEIKEKARKQFAQ